MDAEELHDRRARSFGATAAAYAEHRPDYPVDGVRWGLAAATGAVRRVLDLAAGTGKLTAGLLALGCEVTAVEPDAEMRAQLSALFPQVRTLPGRAESIPLPAGSVDAVVVGQAFHWFDRDAALAEIARVLRPGGALAAFWNREDDSVGWVAGLSEVASSSVTQTWTNDWPTFDGELFEAGETAEFPHAHRRTADSLTATIGTHSHTLVVSEEERAQVLGQVRDYLRSRPETAAGEFEMPLRTSVVRGRRRFR
ncbi:MAG TPA: class I SAM-dependent methyltransferase [Actinophytocola sp.]|jgi:SAM-dependent methyltransferase|uniref:class I SAM-dependent methyltransferase n=1 Tax=Actinophytocola sp. TaxID=1872138 RepID=UPI002F940F85